MSRCLLPIACLFLLAGSALADEKPKPNTLTPKEIADGWVMLFDGETTFGWKTEGQVIVKDGFLRLGDGKQKSHALTGYLFPSDFELIVEVAPGSGDGGKLLIRDSRMEALDGYGSGLRSAEGIMKFRHESDGKTSIIEIESSDGVAKLKQESMKPYGPRAILIESVKQTILIKTIKLRPLNAKPLFNGKNLDGWKVTQSDPKRTATKFEVTKDGELSAKNGPGDLQSEKQFDDFVLQLECKTNGKALNSGVFFRCMPDAYQNGYEAQIQNAYLQDDRTKPLDYGTGAIYRRIAARKVVSNDNEWFTMTVAAHGAHIATWVNGYQTVDWTDDRKPNDNPRQGLRTAKGHLSIQGHDPTTDLLFRNIRIAELAK